MSDILIKGMEMPKENESVFVRIAACGDVLIVDSIERGLVFYSQSQPSIKAIPVPSHGRLIDGDETLHKLVGFNDGWFSSKGIKDIGYSTEEVVKNMPTIIPANN